jgi:transglutaminase-like putative cysteine protease
MRFWFRSWNSQPAVHGNRWRPSYSQLADEKLRLADVQPMLSRIDLKNATRMETIQKLVGALHRNVRYTGVEFGESALIPQFPAETLKRKYGDCKDKAALLVTLLRAAGIDAKLALLFTGPGQDVNPELPGMGAFDHAIVYVPAKDSAPELWIDATAQYSRVGSLPEMDYGRWALVVDPATSALKKIPELTSAQNVHIETREVFLADNGPAKFVERDEETRLRLLAFG